MSCTKHLPSKLLCGASHSRMRLLHLDFLRGGSDGDTTTAALRQPSIFRHQLMIPLRTIEGRRAPRPEANKIGDGPVDDVEVRIERSDLRESCHVNESERTC